MDERILGDDISELSKKLDALLGLVVVLGVQHLHWLTDWVVGFLSEFGLSEECISAIERAVIAGLSGDVVRKEIERAKIKTRKLRKPSFLDRFKEQ